MNLYYLKYRKLNDYTGNNGLFKRIGLLFILILILCTFSTTAYTTQELQEKIRSMCCSIGLPPDGCFAAVLQESSWNPRSINRKMPQWMLDKGHTQVYAYGLQQKLCGPTWPVKVPTTGEILSTISQCEQLFNPDIAIPIMREYLEECKAKGTKTSEDIYRCNYCGSPSKMSCPIQNYIKKHAQYYKGRVSCDGASPYTETGSSKACAAYGIAGRTWRIFKTCTGIHNIILRITFATV